MGEKGLNISLWVLVWDMVDTLSILSLCGDLTNTWDRIVIEKVYNHIFDVCSKYAKK